MGGYYSVACLEVVGVFLIISVTTALSVAWLVGSSALRYHQRCPPQPCMPAPGLQLKDPARPRMLEGAEVLLSTHPKKGQPPLPGRETRLRSWDLMWKERGAGCEVQAGPTQRAVPKLAVPERKEFLSHS